MQHPQIYLFLTLFCVSGFFFRRNVVALSTQRSGQNVCPPIVSRAEWDARDPVEPPVFMPDLAHYLFVHHTEGRNCTTLEQCTEWVQLIQDFHIDDRGWNDIGYTFLIGGEGSIFEGRGWNVVGAHTQGFNDVGYGVSFIGTFNVSDPTLEAQESYHSLAECALSMNKVIPDYEMKGHHQAKPNKTCPGEHLYQTIQDWPHWTDGYIVPFQQDS